MELMERSSYSTLKQLEENQLFLIMDSISFQNAGKSPPYLCIMVTKWKYGVQLIWQTAEIKFTQLLMNIF